MREVRSNKMLGVVSLCNQERDPGRGLLIFDVVTGVGTWVPVGSSHDIMGTRGICAAGGLLYAAYTVGWYETHFATFAITGATLELVDDMLAPETHDPHSLSVHAGRLLVASTGSNELVAYNLLDGLPRGTAEAIWRAGETGVDTEHVNGVWSDDERIVVSAFGPRAGEYWSSAHRGYVHDVTRGERLLEGLYHPHSVRIDDGRICFAESALQRLCFSDRDPIVLSGYVRGAAIAPDGTIFAGSNAARRVSRSRGIVTNGSDVESAQGEVFGRARLFHVDPALDSVRATFDLGDYGPEIYDVLVLP